MNQYRCETCNHPKCEHAVKDGCFSPRKKFAWNHTLHWGCASHSEFQNDREKVLDDLATFLDDADNTSDSGNAQKWVSLPMLFKWMQSKGWQP
jgi:hypothetical protein